MGTIKQKKRIQAMEKVQRLKYGVYMFILVVILAGCATDNDEEGQTDGQDISEEALENQEPENPQGTENPQDDQEQDDPQESPSSEETGDSGEKEEPMMTIFDYPYAGEPVILNPVFEAISFDQPLYLTHAPGDEEAVYIVEKTGKIKRIILATDSQEATPEIYLDLSDVVSADGSEKGLLGLAFHPDYETNGEAYVNYTQGNVSIIAKYINGDPSTATEVLTFEQPYDNHNGGQMVFGPEGYLYIGTGDGGGAGDPAGNAQNLQTLPGSILRIDVNASDAEQAYAIPEDNPYAGNEEGYMEEIYAYGFRNPWRFSYDPYRDQFVIADVGQDAWEEINLLEKGGNYGWPMKEGTHDYAPNEQMKDKDLIDPVWEYEHPVGRSITGGYVVEGPMDNPLTGLYIYGDFVTGLLWGLWWDENGTASHYLLSETGRNIASFGQGPQDNIYLIDFSGGIYMIGLE